MKEWYAKIVIKDMSGIEHPWGNYGRIVKDRWTKTWKNSTLLGLNTKEDQRKLEKVEV